MLSRFPGDLPWTLALAGGLSFAAMGFASLWAEAALGRPSSTSGLAYVFIPILSVAAALAALVVGVVLRWLLSEGGFPARHGTRVSLLSGVVIVVAIGLGAARGVSGVRSSEDQARPRVLMTSPQVERLSVASGTSHVAIPGSVLYADVTGPPPRMALPGGSNTLELSGLSASLGPESGKRASASLEPLNYVTRVDAVATTASGGGAWTVVAVTGRATGRRLMVFVLSPGGQVQHSELLERCWPLDQPPLEKWSLGGAKGGEMVVFPRACEGPLALRMR